MASDGSDGVGTDRTQPVDRFKPTDIRAIEAAAACNELDRQPGATPAKR